MRFFIRIEGTLLEVWPLTRSSRECPTLKVKIVRTGRVLRVFATDIINDY